MPELLSGSASLSETDACATRNLLWYPAGHGRSRCTGSAAQPAALVTLFPGIGRSTAASAWGLAWQSSL